MSATRKKIGFFTGTRAEYGLLRPLMSLVKADGSLKLLLFVSGMHLSTEFGNTHKLIERDGFAIAERVESLLSGDTPSATTKSIGLGMIGLADAFLRNRPDLLVILGDRFEAFAAATAAMVAGIPIAHIHGGELTEGAIDDPIRHSITKMAALHFVSTEEYRRRVIQLGEEPDRVFTVGALGIDQIRDAEFASREEVLRHLPILDDYEASILVTLHPETRHEGTAGKSAGELLAALEAFSDKAIVFTGANADAGGRCINEMFSMHCGRTTNCVFVQSLGSYLYLGLLREVSAVVGNSSSGILEAPAMGVPSVDIGNRQRGRVAPDSVIHCASGRREIAAAVTEALARGPSAVGALEHNPYWHGGASSRIFTIIKGRGPISATKRFFDLEAGFRLSPAG